MAVYTVSITDGSTLSSLAVSAGRGPKGDGFTGGSYSSSTGVITFTSNDGIGFSTSDIRPEITAAVAAAEAAQAGAETAEAGAEAAQAATESIFDQFGDQYLGPKASDPTVDNDGDPLTAGDIYFNTTDSVLKFYSGSAWVAPESIATTAASDAQAAQAAAETAETNAETAQTAAETAETNAAASETAAATSETNAANSASAAAASAASIDPDNIDINGGTIDGTVIGGTTPAAGSFTTGSFTGDVTFGDNDKAIFGAGSDLQIWHDGTTSIIEETGSGDLRIKGANIDFKSGANETYAYFQADGASILYHNGSQKLATTSTGIDVTGDTKLTAGGKLKFNDDRYFTPENNVDGAEVSANGVFRIKTGATPAQRLLVGANGDISFYEATGTTPKFFWDASAESLGIGTSSPSNQLHVASTANSSIRISAGLSGNNDAKLVLDGNGSGVCTIDADKHLTFTYSGSERMRIDSSGNVGIGSTSPEKKLHIFDSTQANQAIRFGNPDATPYGEINYSASGFEHLYIRSKGTTTGYGNIVFETGSALDEAMRIDSSGNLLVGKTSVGVATTGSEIRADGQVSVVREGDTPLFINRKTNDGTIADFRKDGSTVGSIGTNSDKLYIGSGDTGLRFVNTSNQIRPFNTSTGADRDDGFSLGSSGARFKDLYLSGGVYLGGTGSANKLEDYEEGTWTPTAGAGTITVSDTPTYTKVGRWVYLTAVVTMPSQTNSSQGRITGLPFVPKQNGSNSEYGGSIGEHSYGSYIEMSVHSGYPAIIFRPNGGSSASYTDVSGKNFRFSIAYLTNQ